MQSLTSEMPDSFLRVLLNGIGSLNHIGTWVYEPTENRLLWTDTTYEIFGIPKGTPLTPEQTLGYFLPEYRQAVVDAAIETMSKGSPFDFELMVERPDQRRLWVRYKGRTMHENGHCVYMYGTFEDIDVRKRAEMALTDSEARYRSIFDAIRDVYFRSDAKGIVTEITPSILVHSGYPREEIIGRPVADFYYYVSDYEALNRVLRREGRVSDFEIRLKTIDGREVYTSVNASVIHDAAGRFTGIEGILRNVNERILNEKRIAESERRFKATFNSSFQMAAILDLQGRMTDINETALVFGGLPREAFIGKPIWDAPYWGETVSVRTAIQRAFEKSVGGEFVKQETEIGYGGRSIHIDFTLNPVRGEDGAIEFVVAEGRDVTRSVQLLQQLRSLNALYNLVVDISGRLIGCTVDEVPGRLQEAMEKLGSSMLVDRTYIFEFDPDAKRMSNTYEWCEEGISPEKDNLQDLPVDLIPRWMEQFAFNEPIYIEDVDAIPDPHVAEREILQSQGIRSLVTVPMWFGTELVGFLGFDSVRQHKEWDPQVVALLKVMADIMAGTLKRRTTAYQLMDARQRAEEANRAKSEFLANMSHEIRTPMNAILGFTEILLETVHEPVVRSQLTTIQQSGRSLLYLINDLLDLSKIEAGRLNLEPVPVDVRHLLQQIVVLFQTQVHGRDLTLKAEVSQAVPSHLLLDELRLRQILLNLVGNAVKFTPRGSVTIRVDAHATDLDEGLFTLRFDVADTGIGIAKDDLEHIFESFSQASFGENRKFGGTGLGLSISRKLAGLMGGDLTVESQLGQGSTFSLGIRHVQLAQSGMMDTVSDATGSDIRFQPSTLLVVDDVDINIRLVASFLKGQPVEIIAARDGYIGLEKAATVKPDAILMDIRMPRMNGIEATRKLRSKPETASIPVIAFTASMLTHEIEQHHALFNDILIKPVRKGELITVLASHMPHRKQASRRAGTLVHESVTDNRFLAEIRTVYGPRAAALADIPDLDEVERLIVELETLNNSHKDIDLERYVVSLRHAHDSFDFNALGAILKTLPYLP